MQLNQIYNNDCLSILNDSTKIQASCVQVIFADPPYNLSGNGLKSKNSKTGGDFTMVNEDWDKMGETEFINFTNEWIKSSKKVLKPNGSIFIACSYHNMGESMMSLKANGFEVKNIHSLFLSGSDNKHILEAKNLANMMDATLNITPLKDEGMEYTCLFNTK